MIFLALFISFCLLVITTVSLINFFTFPKLDHAKKDSGYPLISVLIPARNEASVISKTIAYLLAQDEENIEILVLDDHSYDGTGEVARMAANGDIRVKIIPGIPLPPGWGGKNWACHQLSTAAQGEWLLFTDADVVWQPQAIRFLAGTMQLTKADLMTVWPTQHTITWGERLVVPLMALAILGYLPVLAVHFLPWRVFSAANGQCMLFRRRVYEKIGGHEQVKSSIIEDVSLSRKIKGAGFKLRMIDGAGLISCRMYQNWQEVRDGYAKNILAGHGNKVFMLILSIIFHWLIFLVPWIWFTFGWFWPSWVVNEDYWPAWPLSLMILGVSIRALTAAFTRQRILDALFFPVSILLMTRISIQAIYWKYKYGGPRWKGRTLSTK